ncbi:hypothetical protein VMCG_04283 [Cytospora schulzeri]|uniref:Rhodopsin domain-containing protein n=1 Tax=Cytospora schulzeri TaxID=448051 RepID=A0A423WSV1_9PEZI|nr:hypothetical protein VMCG_04283 [Valsa malicola]
MVAVALRLLARRVSNRKLEASDYMIIAALVATTAFSAVIAAEPFAGAGLHMAEVQATYGPAPLVTYLKMTLANQCQPFAYNWDQTIPGGHCGNQVLSFQITGSLNVFLDAITLLLPMPYLTTLSMSISKKLILIATFAVGLVTCIFSALRIQSLITMDYSDLTYLAVVPSIYSVLEPNLAITLACVPLLRPLFGGQYSVKGTLIRREWATSNTSGAASSAARQPRKTNRVGFQTLDDSIFNSNEASSQVELQPMGPKYEAEVSARVVDAHGGAHSGQSGNSSEENMTTEHADDRVQGGIMVKQEWEVKELILALMGVAIYEHINSVTLSLPLSPVLTFLTILLPVVAAANAITLPYLTRKSLNSAKSLLNPTHPAVIQILQGIITTVFGTLYATYIVPGDSRVCELSTLWQRLFRGKNDKTIRAIQDAFECCGFRSIKDMAWPFPPTDILSCILARRYAGRFQAFSWSNVFGHGSRRAGYGSSSSRALLNGHSSEAESVDGEDSEAGVENGHGYGGVDNDPGRNPRTEPSSLNEERNVWER